MQQQLHYSDNGRSGYVIYNDNISELSFYYELGGGNCVAVISIPNTSEWEKQTGRTLEDRNAVITFIAEQARKDQVRNGSYKISENFIELFSE